MCSVNEEMMTYLSIVSGLITLVAMGVYVLAIIRGSTKPSKASWLIWAGLSFLTAGGMWQAGTLNWQMAATALGDCTVALLALRYGKSGWTGLDKFALIGALVGLALWVSTSDPLYAIVISLGVNFIGAIPTLVKTWKRPDEESPTMWVMMCLASALQTAAVPAWTVAMAAQPVSYLVQQLSMVLLIFLGSRTGEDNELG